MSYNIWRNLPADMHPMFDNKMLRWYEENERQRPLVVLSCSYGKDSTYCLLQIVDQGLPLDVVVFVDTGWEFPQMYEHIEKAKEYVKKERGDSVVFVHIKSEKGFDNMLQKYRWPAEGRRWCTAEKIALLNRFYRKYIYSKGYEIIEIIGFAADEESRIEGKKVDKKKNKKIWSWFPMGSQEWNTDEQEALLYCKERGFEWSGLYEHFHRVSCFCCPLKSNQEIRVLREHYPELWAEMLKKEDSIPVTENYVTFRGKDSLHELDRKLGAKAKLFHFEYIKGQAKPKKRKIKRLPVVNHAQLGLFG